MKRLVFLLALSAMATAANGQPRLAEVFTDHAVVQRDRPIALWGRAAAGEPVTVALGDVRARATADSDGRWRVDLPAMAAGGPYRLSVTGPSGEDSAADILVGDVWLCSGQSNMEWPVGRSLNGEAEAASANDPLIRLLTIPQRTAVAQREGFEDPIAWQISTPETTREFSAVCYFMARELRRSQDVPMGLIDSSWGGTRIRPWMSEAAARAGGAGEDAALLSLYGRDPAEASRLFGEQWGDWWRARTGQTSGSEPWNASSRLTWRRFPGIGFWENWEDPAFANFNGFVWARRRVQLTEVEARGGATLSLGVVDDLDQTWVNGVGVGSQFGWSNAREYELPPGLLRAGENEIIVNIGDSWDLGGFQGPADQLKLRLADGTTKPLGEGWEYSVVEPNLGSPPRAPWDSHAGVAVIYNAMIAPLGLYGFRGVVWYQGESDVGVPGYSDRLSAMMADWRRQFRSPELPFVIVGLANFGARASTPVASGWAELREQQRVAARNDPAAALVVAMDLGEPGDIHPPNKQEVGRRAALAAGALAYRSGDSIGPEASRARRTGAGIVVDFTGVTGSLQAYSGTRALAFELCGETQESCRFAEATPQGSSVVIVDDGRPATRVRHAWAETPVTNLYDRAPLPVGPFELRISTDQ